MPLQQLQQKMLRMWDPKKYLQPNKFQQKYNPRQVLPRSRSPQVVIPNVDLRAQMGPENFQIMRGLLINMSRLVDPRDKTKQTMYSNLMQQLGGAILQRFQALRNPVPESLPMVASTRTADALEQTLLSLRQLVDPRMVAKFDLNAKQLHLLLQKVSQRGYNSKQKTWLSASRRSRLIRTFTG